ncbi:DUF6319 family protein [Gordonia aurantiaca]|uniref:DUF6319 family protein n=1 Tax=Gordonia sp. B21 TaxID=3151852 RepID=UPI0032639E4A
MCEHGRVNAQRKAGLTPDDLRSLSAGLDAGKRVTVYLRDPIPALGIDAGTSARVISVDGATVTVRPKGVDDQLPFEADELSISRPSTGAAPARKRAAKAAPAPAAAPTTPVPSRGAATPGAGAPAAGSTPTAAPRTDSVAQAAPKPKPTQSKTTRRGKTTQAPVSVTVTSAGESTWTVTVSHGSKKGKAGEVTADRVARAMRELGDETAIAAVDEVIESAREAAQRRIEELTRELENARAALAHLEGDAIED